MDLFWSQIVPWVWWNEFEKKTCLKYKIYWIKSHKLRIAFVVTLNNTNGTEQYSRRKNTHKIKHEKWLKSKRDKSSCWFLFFPSQKQGTIFVQLSIKYLVTKSIIFILFFSPLISFIYITSGNRTHLSWLLLKLGVAINIMEAQMIPTKESYLTILIWTSPLDQCKYLKQIKQVILVKKIPIKLVKFYYYLRYNVVFIPFTLCNEKWLKCQL